MAMVRWGTITPPHVEAAIPHGSPTPRMLTPSRSSTTTRMAMSSPMVAMAAANTGLPTSGRSDTRSTRPANRAVNTTPMATAGQNPSPRSTARYEMAKAPVMSSAGWANESTWVDL